MLWIERFETLEELRQAVRRFGRTYNEQWLIERHGYRTTSGTRRVVPVRYDMIAAFSNQRPVKQARGGAPSAAA